MSSLTLLNRDRMRVWRKLGDALGCISSCGRSRRGGKVEDVLAVGRIEAKEGRRLRAELTEHRSGLWRSVALALW